MKSCVVRAGAALFLSATVTAAAAAQESGRQFGGSFAVGLVAAPLGEVASSFGTRAIPGEEYDLRVFTRSARGNEWTVGLLSDRFRMDHVIDLDTRSAFEYASTAVVVGRLWSERTHGVPLRFGLELGWRHFTASSSRPDVYTRDLAVSRVRGNAALLGVSYGIDVAAGTTLVRPRLRIETSYPDFGGGDGYSALHRESDLGFRASLGLELNHAFLSR